MQNLTRKTLIFFCVLLMVTLIGIAYGLKPRPMWSTTPTDTKISSDLPEVELSLALPPLPQTARPRGNRIASRA